MRGTKNEINTLSCIQYILTTSSIIFLTVSQGKAKSILDESERDFHLGTLNPIFPLKSNASAFFEAGDESWDKIVNGMIWTEGPAWWNEKLVFSDVRLGKIFSWDPETKKTGVVLENAGNDNAKTSTWLEPFSNGLLFNPNNQELYICEHGNRGIKALNSNDQLRQITKSDWILNSPNDLALQKSTGDIFFTDPFFGKMTFNANFERGNLDQIPDLAEPGYSGIYRIRTGAGDRSSLDLIDKLEQPNGIGVTSENKLIVSRTNETEWIWYQWDIHHDGSFGERSILLNLTAKLSGDGLPDGLDIDERDNVWASAPGGLIIFR